MTKYLLDTNVLLRFFLDDDKRLSAKAKKLFQQAESGACELVVTDVALAEAVWVLTSFYKVARETVAETLSSLIGKVGIRCPNASAMLDALDRYRETKCDFFDCYLGAIAAETGHAIASFDRDFRTFSDIDLWAWK